MKTAILDFNGSSSIGLFGYVNDHYLLLGKEVPTNHDKELKEVFKVPIHRITIAGTSFIGVFIAGNNKKILVPGITFDEELEELDNLGIKYEVLTTKLTCLGNNIAFTEDNALVNPEFSDAEVKKIEELMDVKAETAKISGMMTAGSIIVINGDKALTLNNLSRPELELIEQSLNVTATPGTVNLGTQQVKSGILCNKNGFAIGKASGGPEIANASDALGFNEDE